MGLEDLFNCIEDAFNAFLEGLFGGIIGFIEGLFTDALITMFNSTPILLPYTGFLLLYSFSSFIVTIIGSIKSGILYIIGLFIAGIIIGSFDTILIGLISILGLFFGAWVRDELLT